MKRTKKTFKTALSHILRNPYHAVAVVLVMSQTFFVIACLIYVLAGSSRIISYFESKAQISAYFSKEINSEEQINDLKETLNGTGKIKSMKFISKEEALEIFKKQENKPELTDFITADTLPSSLDINTQSPSDLFEIEKILKSDTRIKDINLLKEAVESLTKISMFLRNVGIVGSISLLFTSLLIVLIVIGLNISIHKDEIEIMRLVGAGGGLIRWPFVLEGAIYGLVSATLAWLLSFGLLIYASPIISSFFAGIPLLPVPLELIGAIWALLAILGLLLGLVGSLAATSKYLKI